MPSPFSLHATRLALTSFYSVMRRSRVIVFGLVPVFACALLVLNPHGRDSRLSAAVAIVSDGVVAQAFLQKPGPGYVQAYARFEADLPDDVLFGIDHEFIEGVGKPLWVSGGDWMSCVVIQRTGAVWVATGTAETMKGKPSGERSWKILDLGAKLQPNAWYLLRCEADFGARQFRRFSVKGPGVDKSFDLSGLSLDYPNMIPFSDRAMSYYVAAMRGRGMAKGSGKPVVYFDDVEGGSIGPDGRDRKLFASGFEEGQPIGAQPVTSPVIKLNGYRQGRWYLERDESIFHAERRPFARSGSFVGIADANLE